MAKNSPGTLNSRTVRISLRTYLLLKEMSESAGLSMAETLDKLIYNIASLMPVISAGSMPAFRVTNVPTLRVAPVTTIATNGSKAAAFRINPKGARYA